jgi:hypothetical protein
MKFLGMVFLFAMTLSAESPAPVRIFLEPQNGFESYIAAAMIKKGVPAQVTTRQDDADYTIESVVISKEESAGGKLARCAFMYCIGIDGTQTATVRMIDRNGLVAWAYNVRKLGAANQQSSAEAIAKHLKQFLATNKGSH